MRIFLHDFPFSELVLSDVVPVFRIDCLTSRKSSRVLSAITGLAQKSSSFPFSSRVYQWAGVLLSNQSTKRASFLRV